jgi:Flp pilus assembly protein TadG
MMRRLRTALARFRSRTDGAAAVEFALVLPALATLLVGVIQYGGMVVAYQQMHDGVTAGAVYVMRGGSDSSATRSVALQAWPNQPSDAAVTVTQACTCAGAAATCGGLCPDGSYPLSYTTIAATGTYVGMMGNKAMSTSQVIRTQ